MLKSWRVLAVLSVILAVIFGVVIVVQAAMLHADGWRFAWGAAGTVVALIVSVISVVVATGSVWYARESANAARRSADLAEVVEAGRHFGWRIEARTNESTRLYTLRNVGTVGARDVHLSGDYLTLAFHGLDNAASCHIAAGQARLFVVQQAFGDQGGVIDITWTPDLPNAQPMTWTESPPMARFYPPLSRADWGNLRKMMERLAEGG